MPDAPQRATRQHRRRLSPIWIVPLVAVLIGMWMLYDNLAGLGPTITLEMKNAEGIEAGKTLIKTRNVEVGRVEEVALSDDMSHTVITARMKPGTERMLNDETRFWVVKPRIDREGISGLGTVLSGAYIQLLPGNADASQRNFDVLDQPPVAPPDAPGIRINLVSQVGSSLRTGDPITYQGFTVGRVENTAFDPQEKEMRHRLYIQSPYDVLVTDTTRFWVSSGIDLNLNSQGFQVNVESIESLIGGGVTFGVPEDVKMGQPAEPGATYQLFSDRESAREGTFDRYLDYVLLVDDTVRGLGKGDPVEYRGVRVGTVEAVPWRFSAPQPDTLSRFAIPVLIRIEPQRFDDIQADFNADEWRGRLRGMFENGLRATLKAGNLLTGALFVDLNFKEDSAAYKALTFEGKPVFPTTSGGFAQIEQKVANLLDKLNELKVDPILDSLDQTLATTQATMRKVNEIATSVETVLNDPATRQLPQNLNATLRQTRETLEGFAPGSQGYRELNDTLSRLESLMRDLQPIARTLSEEPNALIFDSQDTPDPQPKAPR
ncbi:paraquat-inducible protein B [Chromohalobacter marismortui]|uniref:Paraquat-inducible protein B n=1 Tax=Chromohalobacter marismortui TaxID=42055 RepID=A0A4R7NPL0_9GAMM|nr:MULTISPECIES: intermembrane transport protein PqiB [Chromohalobacter]MCI0508805.1 intermembrane transport protein PqiB [Chromohalobacter sp.]MCI0594338.1 intermembrane transport protein PqiB [Chromohalobacter sp.]TDU22825.1 paraquat-inducible protein B [Chromohalobacter marismortui]